MNSVNAMKLRRLAFTAALIFWIASCCGQAETITPALCSLTLSPSSASYTVFGGLGSVNILTLDNCFWTATSDVDWLLVTDESNGRGSGTVTFRVAANTTNSERTTLIKVMGTGDQPATALHHVSQAAAEWLPIRGAYIFALRVDPGGACAWPETTFYWPVVIEVTSYEQGTTLGSIVFPATALSSSNTWSITASPIQAQLEPRPDSPGPVWGPYDLVVDGGRWEAEGIIHAHDGRGEIASGTAVGAKQILTLRDSDKRWECQSDLKWSLLVRYGDED